MKGGEWRRAIQYFEFHARVDKRVGAGREKKECCCGVALLLGRWMRAEEFCVMVRFQNEC